jgi:hypothetical protein
VWNDPLLEIVPPETWVGSAPPPLAVRPLIDSLRDVERPLLDGAGPAVTRPTWDRLVIAARDGTRSVLADRLAGDAIDRVHVYRGAVAGIDQLLAQVILFEGVRYALVDLATGRVTEIDAVPAVSPDRARIATASFSISGHDPNRVQIFRMTPNGPELEWSSEAWGGADPVWLGPATLELDRVEEHLAAGSVQLRRTRVRLRLEAGSWRH